MVLLLTFSVASGANGVQLIIWFAWKRFLGEAFIKKEHLTAVFFDLEKAYDTTWNYGIMRDLNYFGLKGRLPHFIDNFLSNSPCWNLPF